MEFCSAASWSVSLSSLHFTLTEKLNLTLLFNALIEIYLHYQNVLKHYFLAGSFMFYIILINYTRVTSAFLP